VIRTALEAVLVGVGVIVVLNAVLLAVWLWKGRKY
jgi:hypothetical protein